MSRGSFWVNWASHHSETTRGDRPSHRRDVNRAWTSDCGPKSKVWLRSASLMDPPLHIKALRGSEPLLTRHVAAARPRFTLIYCLLVFTLQVRNSEDEPSLTSQEPSAEPGL